MSLFERLRLLQAPADGGASGSDSGGTPAADAGGAAAADTKGAAGADAGGAKAQDGKPDAKPKEGAAPAKRSFTKPGEAAEQKKDEAKPDAKGKDGAADAPYELKLPEGFKADEAKLKSFTGWAKEKGLSADQASEALAFYAGQQKEQVAAWAKQGDDWYAALEKDPEFGGANVKESGAALQKALKQFDPKGELVADLEKYGVENLPSLCKFLRRVGLAAGEDGTAADEHKGAPAQNDEQARNDALFPSHRKLREAAKST